MKNAPRPYRNQRLARPKQKRQQHLLEVSLRASKERERKVRFAAGLIFKLVLFCSLGTAAWIGAREGLQRFVWENPNLALTDLRVATDGTLTREQILVAANVEEGRNILSINLGNVRSGLYALPQVERLDIRRTLPNRLEIEVSEHQPVAWLASKNDAEAPAGENSYLVDARGFIVKSKKYLPEHLHLPVITGVVEEDIAPNQQVKSFAMKAALELLKLNGDNTKWQIRSIDVSREVWIVATDKSRARITFGLDNITQQLTRLRRILEEIEPSGREVQTVNLLASRNTPVTFTEPPAPVIAEEEAAAETAPPTPEPTPAARKAATPAPKSASPTPTPKASAKSSGKPSSSSSASGSGSRAKRGSNGSSSVRKPFRLKDG